jgi:hypothetical protein
MRGQQRQPPTAAPRAGLTIAPVQHLPAYGLAPTRLVWGLLLGVSLAAAAVPAMPETVPGRPGVLASLRPRLAVPRQARATFAIAVPCLIAAWMLSGFRLSLGRRWPRRWPARGTCSGAGW